MKKFPSTRQYVTNNWIKDLSYLFIGILVFYFTFLGSYSLFSPDEARYAEISREMLTSGNWLIPKQNNVVFFDKPILHYWLQMLAMKLFGMNEWGIRFFPALWAILGCIATYIAGRIVFNRMIGLLSGVILATTPIYFIGGHYANLDLEVSVFISLSLLCFLIATRGSKGNAVCIYLSYFFASLAFLTKGLIGLFLPLLIVGMWLFLTKRYDLLNRKQMLKGLLIILITALPWYILASLNHPNFLYYFFYEQQIIRFLSQSNFNNASPFWFYVPVVILGFLPWSFVLINELIHKIKLVINKEIQSTELFLLLWIITIFIFFSIPSSKIVTYILPIFPPCALLAGNSIANNFSKKYFLIKSFISVILLLLITFEAQKLNFRGTKTISHSLKEIKRDDDIVVHYYKYFPDNSFYLNQTSFIIYNWDNTSKNTDNWSRELLIGRSFHKKNKLLINEQKFNELWVSNKRIFVLLTDNYLPRFHARVKNSHLIAKDKNLFLFSNYLSTISEDKRMKT